ncbi:phosphatase PAP2 family protein [Streptacidiphilus sp. N1-10]|uniref:Phosphatase PAP2 family protein n=1 Tax=Streptacidiphilus jeojiensis TaxID=3229225 RepID=A0ABV6XK73_9ACTN
MTQTPLASTVSAPEQDGPGTDAALRWARFVTRAVDPMNIVLGVMLGFGAVRYGLSGAAWGLVGALFSGVLPQLGISAGVRRGRVGDRYVGDRARRVVILPLIMLSVGVGLALMYFGGAPRPLTAMILGQFATMVPVTAITTRWKISIHTSAGGGAVAMLAVAFGAWALLGYAVVAAVGWSRVVLRDHTRAQCLAGAVLGSLVAGSVFWAAR